jgi:hypothetical protein
MDQPQLRQHVTILGWLHIGAALFAILLGAFLFLLLGGIGLVAHDREARTFLGIIGTCVAVFLLLISLPGLLAGYGLLQRRPWGRILAFVVAALHIFNIPIGTALGIYTFVVLADPGAEAYFQPAS